MKSNESNGTNIIDPIHGSITISPFELKIIDSPPFQRLRKIKQLGNVHLVFPGATHTRFSHSLGVMHLAGRLFDAITKKIPQSEELKRVGQRVRMAALLHDIGHGPFSHQFEQFLKAKGFKREALSPELHIPNDWRESGIKEQKISHEDFSLGIIKHLFESQNLEPEFGFGAQDLCCLLDDKIKPTEDFKKDLAAIAKVLGADGVDDLKLCFKSILSGEIDADRLDYLQRDSLFCGAKIAGIDVDHILNSINLTVDQKKKCYIDLNKNAVGAVEQILFSRKLMFDQVYTHHVNAALDGMLVNLMSKFLSTEDTLTYQWYIRLTDDVVEAEIKKEIYDEKITNGDTDLQAKFFLTRTTQKKVYSKVYDKLVVEERKHELSSIWEVPQKGREVVEFRMKDFTKLDRDKIDEDSSIIKISSEYPAVTPQPINLVSEVFKSSLWRCDSVKIVIFESLKNSASTRKLEDKLKIAHFNVGGPPQAAQSNAAEVKAKT